MCIRDRLDLSPSQCIVFEDAPKGVKAAKSGGFKTIGVGKVENLYEADFVIAGFENFSYQTISKLYRKLSEI